MRHSFLKFSCAAVLLVGSTSIAAAQDTTMTTKKEVIVNSDGTYTVIEYPVGKEVMLNLLPGTMVAGSKGMARVVRTADGTKVYVDVSGAPATTTNYYAYAVDPAGAVTSLGPVPFSNGVAKAEFTTPMNQFMVVLSPNEGLTALDPTTTVFHSEVPAGYTIVPRRSGAVQGVTISRTTTTTTPAAYTVPLLNVPSFGDKEREVKLRFGGDLKNLEAKAFIDKEEGVTKVRMRFADLKQVPSGKRFTLWTSAPDGTFNKLGQVVNSGKNDEAEIRSETALTDFGLFLTVEDADVMVPTSKTYSVFAVPSS